VNFLALNEFAAITVDAKHVYGVKLKRNGKKLLLKNMAALPRTDGALSRMAGELKIDSAVALVISAVVPDGQFFCCSTLELPPKELRSALQFELPRHLPVLPENCIFNAALLPDKEQMQARVWAMPGKNLDELLFELRHNSLFPDAVIHPLQAITANMTQFAVYLPDYNGNFYWRNNGYAQCPVQKELLNQPLLAFLQQEIVVEDNVASTVFTDTMLPALLLANYAAANEFAKSQRALNLLLPDKLRAKRYRVWLKIAAILLCLSVMNFAVLKFRTVWRNHAAVSLVENEINSLNSKSKVLQNSLNSREKKAKEMQKAVDSGLFTEEIAEDWAKFAELIPDSTLVSSIKWQNDKVNMSIQTTSELNIPELLAQYKRYKVTVANQGSRGTIQQMELVLEPAEAE